MSRRHGWPATLAAGALLGLALAGCATRPPGEGRAVWAGEAVGAPPQPDPALRQALVARAIGEWELFGRQTVLLRGDEESIPHVGAWEDDGGTYSRRVNDYWRAVGKPQFDGLDCGQPWSAAFVSWVMREAGVPEDQFPSASAHGVYLAHAINAAGYPGRYFVPRDAADYSPSSGDLICAFRGTLRPAILAGETSPEAFRGTNTHCDLVVSKDGRLLDAIGGNVRNSVSKVTLELDGDGRLQAVPRRTWFLILQNRL